MKKNLSILALVLFSASANAADIKFNYNGQTVSLVEAYYNMYEAQISEMFEIVLKNDGKNVHKNVLCVEANNKENTLGEIEELSSTMDGPFEEIALHADVSADPNYPISIELYDMPNETSLGIVNVQFCK